MPRLSFSDVKREVKQQLHKAKTKISGQNVIPHKDVLSQMLEKVELLDYQKEAKTDKKLSKKHFLVITVEKILELAKKYDWGLCKRLDFIYLYNGAYWDEIEKESLQSFLGLAAYRMGVDRFESKYHRFRDELLKQFIVTAHLPAPEKDGPEVLINLKNGTVEINPEAEKRVNLRQPESDDFITYQLPFEYDPYATSPRFDKYLDKVLPSKDLQKLLAEYLGYIFLKPSTLKLEKTLLLYGTGANGKSVFFDIVNAMLGDENVSTYTLKSLTNQNGYYRAKLANKLLNYATEIDGEMNTALFKQLVSGEPVEARLPYGEPFTLTNYAKLIFNCNELPSDVEHTNAFFRRFLIVPFDVTIPPEEQDKELSRKIIENELSGVFNWVIEGLHRLLEQKGFTECEEVNQQVENYRKESDSVLSFIDQRGYKSSKVSYTRLSELYQGYKRFCEQDGYRACSNRKFSTRLKNAGYTTDRKEYGRVFYLVQDL
ncbi:DNA primase family protein [Rhodohalobacter barkolensis]|uniref:DNA primase n=1 Tax=Rhodohalobacter barkolensis TaxID=2053187 RepID=A0A2N0VHQ6_9BACT|nr:phage/plasmid primase, P4 family [Rhodohalobacter barkolensis]PKD43694.1 DNA primase [Rhodohalobacter barkolensis]